MALVLACAGSEESSYNESFGLNSQGASTGFLARDDSDGQFAVQTVVVEKVVMVEKEVMKEVVVESEMMMDEFAMEMSESATAVPQQASGKQLAQNVNISTQPQNRIIVRNADMRVEADDPIATVDSIGDLAVARGGWVVNINTIDEGGYYHITIRIPAETLDDRHRTDHRRRRQGPIRQLRLHRFHRGIHRSRFPAHPRSRRPSTRSLSCSKAKTTIASKSYSPCNGR